MYKGSDVLGKKIVAHDGGEQVGHVQDVIFDHQSNQLLGLLVKRSGWFSKAQVVPIQAVQSIGPDSVVITAKDTIADAEQFPEIQAILERKTVLKDTKIMTDDGQFLGTFLDLYFDEHSWQLAGYEVSGGLFADIYSGRSFVPAPLTLTIGEEYAFVDSNVADRMKAHGGGLESIIEASGEQLHVMAETAGEKLQSTKAATAEKLQAQRQATKKQLQTITDSAGKHLQSARQVVDSTWQNAVEQTSEAAQQVLPHRHVEQAKGRRVQQPIKTETDFYIAAPGQIVTDTVIEKARLHHKEEALLDAVGLTIDRTIRTEAQNWVTQSGEKLKAGTKKIGEHLHEGMEEVKTETHNLWDTTRERATELQKETAQAFESRRIQAALGRHASRTILDDEDHVILPEGAVITHEAIERAREANVLPMLLDSVDGPYHSPANTSTKTLQT